ncbi:MAG: gliding motility-associated C-terminal domain-containing protein [Bacteroidota bacterium]
MKYYLTLWFLTFTLCCLQGQSLVPNGDFEDLECPGNPYNSIDSTATWYSITGADAYWLHDDCPVDESLAGGTYFVNFEEQPFSGKGFISLEGAATVSGFHVSEGVGIALNDSLIAGKPYYIEMAAMNQQFILGAQGPGYYCGDQDDEFIQIHFAEEPLKFSVERNGFGTVIIGRSDNSAFKLEHRLSQDANYIPDEWIPYWECFIAAGNASHIGITGHQYKLDSQNNCVEEDMPGALYHFGHSIDAVQLVEIPTEIDTSVNICEDGGWVDLRNYFSNLYTDKATFIWDDGCTDPKRVFREMELRTAEMILPCITVPITLNIEFGSGCLGVVYNDTMPQELEVKVIICNDKDPEPVSLLSFIPANMQAEAVFSWPDGDGSAERVLETPGDYEIEVSTSCFQFPLTLHAESSPCETHVYKPNIFSPNGDGINDFFELPIYSAWEIGEVQLRIFDRWGNLVFESVENAASWDGNVKGNLANEGVYLWTLEYLLLDEMNTRGFESGDVVLIR